MTNWQPPGPDDPGYEAYIESKAGAWKAEPLPPPTLGDAAAEMRQAMRDLCEALAHAARLPRLVAWIAKRVKR